MLSICTSVYQETDSLEIFIRSVFGNASKPQEIEIIIANDEAYQPTSELLNRLSLEFPNLVYFNNPKESRVKFFKNRVKFYRRNEIFNSEELDDMTETIGRYERGELSSLWFPPGGLYNRAAKLSHGDTILLVPADYICFGDLTKLYEAYKAIPGDIIGHFDWVDTTSLDPMPDILGSLRKFKTKQEFNEKTNEWLQQAFSNNVAHVWQQHGMRMVRKDLFEKAGMFDGRWFIRSWNDDSLNRRLEKFAGTYRLLDLDQTKSFNPYFGTTRGKSWNEPNYLYSKYRGVPEIHNYFLSRIQFYLEREGI